LTDEPKKPKNSKKRSIMFALLAFCAAFIVGGFYAMIAAGEEVERDDRQTGHTTPRAEYVSYQMAQALPIAILFGVVGLSANLFWCYISAKKIVSV